MPKTAAHRKTPERGSTRGASGPRPFWSGTISFGLVSVPVDLYPATRDSRVSLRMLGPDGEPLKREYHSPETGDSDLEAAETSRGFEVAEGKFVTVSDDELERLAPEKSRDIDLRVFVPVEEVSPVYFDKPYYLTPGDKSGKAYRLLAQAMETMHRAGIATFVMRGREYLVAILSERGILRAQTLRFNDEVRKPAAIGLPARKKSVSANARALENAIGKASKDGLDLREMRDEYAESVLKLAEKKMKRGKGVVESEPSGESQPSNVVDLMEVLKKSLEKKN